MIDPNETDLNQEFETKVRSTFHVQDPDQLFIDRLQKKLEDRFKGIVMPTGGEEKLSEPPSRMRKMKLLLSPLAWGMIGLILLAALIWGIKTLIPRVEPIIGSQSSPFPVVSPAPNIEPTRAGGVPIPIGALAITSKNAAQIKQLASWGKETISAVAWAPDGKSFAVQSAGKIYFYDRETFQEIGKINTGSSSYTLAYSPDGTKLATGYDNGSIKIWDVSSGRVVQALTTQGDFIASLAFSPIENILASINVQAIEGNPSSLTLWDANTGQEIRTFDGAINVAFSPDGAILATSEGKDQTVRLWDVASGQELRRFTGHTDYVYGLAFSPDGRSLASTSSDMTIKLWDVATGNEIQTFTDQAIPNSVTFLPDGDTLISIAEGEPIKLWDIASAQVRRTIGVGTEGGTFSLSPDGTMVLYYSLWGGDAIRLLDVTTGEELGNEELANDELGRLDWKTYLVTSLAISPDGRILAAGLHSGGIKLLDAATGQELRNLSGHTKDVETYKEVLSLDFSPDGALLASSAMDTTTRLWDVATGEELSTIDGIPEGGWSGGEPTVSFSPDGTLLAIAGSSGQVKVWDVANNVELRTLGGVTDGSYADEVGGVALSPDGKILASGYDSASITLWDASSGQELRTLKHDNSGMLTGVSQLEFSPDGKLLAAGYWDADLVMWDITSGNKLYTHSFSWEDEITDMDFSPGGDVLAVGSGMASMALLDATSGKELVDLKSAANGVVFSPDGRLLISGDYYGGIKLWGIPETIVTQPIVTELPSEAFLPTQEPPAPTPEGLSIEKTPIPILLTGDKIDNWGWSPDGRYIYYSQQGVMGEPGPDQVAVTLSFLEAYTGESCKGFQEVVKIVDNEWGKSLEGAPLYERLLWLADNRLLYRSLSGELMAITPCRESIENWTAYLPDVITSLPYNLKADGSQILLQGEQAYWLFTPSTQQSVKLGIPLPEEGMRTSIGWIPREEKLYGSWIEDRGDLWIIVATIDPVTGAASPFYEVKASRELSGSDSKSASVQWIDKDLVLVYDTITGDSLIDLSSQPIQSTNLFPALFGFEKPSSALIAAVGATHASTRQDYHLMLQTDIAGGGTYYIYHPESGLVDEYPIDVPLLVVYPNGEGWIAASYENRPSFDSLRVILVDSNIDPYDLVVKGHAPIQEFWSFATILPGAEQVLFSSSQGISIVDLHSGDIASFWGYENLDQSQYVTSSVSPDKKTVVSFARISDHPGEPPETRVMYWLHLEP